MNYKNKSLIIAATLLTTNGCAYLSGTEPLRSNYNYDWYYSSEVKTEFDKFENTTKISITPIDIIDETKDSTSITIFYVYDTTLSPEKQLDNAYFLISKTTGFPRLENTKLKIYSNSKIHSFDQIDHSIKSHKTGSGSSSSYSTSYLEQTFYTEVSVYKFRSSTLCEIPKNNELEFKADKPYKLNKSYSISINNWCNAIDSINSRKTDKS